MAWTSLASTLFDPDKPVLGSILRAISENITAFANGDTGAPSIQTAAIADGAVTSAKIADGTIQDADIAIGTIDHGKFQADQGMSDWVANRFSGAATTEVGMVVFASYAINSPVAYGGIVDGDLLEPASTGATSGSSLSSSHTYRCLGYVSGINERTLWQRVS